MSRCPSCGKWDTGPELYPDETAPAWFVLSFVVTVGLLLIWFCRSCEEQIRAERAAVTSDTGANQ